MCPMQKNKNAWGFFMINCYYKRYDFEIKKFLKGYGSGHGSLHSHFSRMRLGFSWSMQNSILFGKDSMVNELSVLNSYNKCNRLVFWLNQYL